jgi:hypothetical protein
LKKGVEDPTIIGWHSRILGKKEPAWTIVASGKIHSSSEIITSISFALSTEDAIKTISLS